jgi:ATP-dependent Lon protease
MAKTNIKQIREKKTKDSSKTRERKWNKKSNKGGQNNDSDDDSMGSELDIQEYRKFLYKLFPSHYLKDKIKTKTSKKQYKEEEDDEEGEEKDDDEYQDDDDEYQEDDEGEEEEYDDEDEEEGEEAEDEWSSEEEPEPETNKCKKTSKKKSDKSEKKGEKNDKKSNKKGEKKGEKEKVNIIFTIGADDEDYDEEYDDDYDDYENEEEEAEETEDEDVEVSSVGTDELTCDDEEDEDYNDEKDDGDVVGKAPVIQNNPTYDALLKLLESNPHDKSIQKCIRVYEEETSIANAKKMKKEKKQKEKNARIFRNILTDKNTTNDLGYYKTLDPAHQHKIIKELKSINKQIRIEKPYRMTLIDADIPVEYKACAMKKVNYMRYMDPGSGEYYKSKNWVDTFMRIPFGKYEKLPVTIEDGIDQCHDFIEKSQRMLDQAVYGLGDAKMQIMQMLGQLVTNPAAIGTAIAIHGPPGTGKTSLVKEGISKILNRPFAFIALGGATDSSFLEGHGYTYEGSTWGKIVQTLIDSQCMNPVFYFDELDKISDTPRGEEIVGILTHLTDTSQNSQFHDKYFSEISFDLSKCLFIFSYNDETKVNPILRDRMYRIKTKGYGTKEKLTISQDYLLPKIRDQIKFRSEDIVFPEEVVGHIIDNYCEKEMGVRNLKRCLEIIFTKLNLFRLMKPGSNLFEGDGEFNFAIQFPFVLTRQVVDKLIKHEKEGTETWRSFYV